MLSVISLLVILCFIKDKVFCLNFKNNACNHYYDYPLWFIDENCYFNPNILLNTSTLIENAGFLFETHTMTTDDGYFLTLFRIPSKYKSHPNQSVLLVHGLFSNPRIFVANENNSLVFNLLYAGYDVWLGFGRGTEYSAKSTLYSVNDPQYWNYSLDELGKYDTCGMIKYVAEKTGRNDLIYIGHSQGTTTAFMCFSENNKIQNLVEKMVAMSPIVFLEAEILKFIAVIEPFLVAFFNFLNIKGLFYQENFIYPLQRILARLFPYLFVATIDISLGKHSKNYQPNDLLISSSNFPCGTSVKQLEHFMQLYKSKKFQKYDYGKSKNFKIYGQTKPPQYDLNKVHVPVALLYGLSDIYATKYTTGKLFKLLGSKKKIIQYMPSNIKFKFNHFEFLIGNAIQNLLYEPMIYNVLPKLT